MIVCRRQQEGGQFVRYQQSRGTLEGFMALYNKPVRLLMHEMIADIGLHHGQVLMKDRVVTWFAEKYPLVKNSTISAHLIRMSTNAPSRMHYSAKAGEDDLFFQLDGSRFRLYDPGTDPAPIYEKPNLGSETPTGPEAEPPMPSEFAYEADLRDFLAKNLSLIESGLHLYQDDGVTGMEFPAGGRFIDILAVDAQANLVVIELKVSRGYDRVVGQLLRYMSWIRKYQADQGQTVRGIIIARELSEDLLLACVNVPGVELFEYELRVQLRRVSEA
jgi:endonuclease